MNGDEQRWKVSQRTGGIDAAPGEPAEPEAPAAPPAPAGEPAPPARRTASNSSLHQTGTGQRLLTEVERFRFDIAGYLPLGPLLDAAGLAEARDAIADPGALPAGVTAAGNGLELELRNIVELGGMLGEVFARPDLHARMVELVWGEQVRLISSRALVRRAGVSGRVTQGGRADPRRFGRYRAFVEGEFRCLLVSVLIALDGTAAGDGAFGVIPGQPQGQLRPSLRGPDRRGPAGAAAAATRRRRGTAVHGGDCRTRSPPRGRRASAGCSTSTGRPTCWTGPTARPRRRYASRRRPTRSRPRCCASPITTDPPRREMRLGLFLIMPAPAGSAPGSVVERALADGARAEELGFDAVWVTEHHGSDYGWCSAPSVMAGALAVRTRRVDIGYAVNVTPLHHSVRLAEEIATVDQLSRGRVIAGFGPGYSPVEYAPFDADFDDRHRLHDEGIRRVVEHWRTTAGIRPAQASPPRGGHRRIAGGG